jgi:hypothetical protein
MVAKFVYYHPQTGEELTREVIEQDGKWFIEYYPQHKNLWFLGHALRPTTTWRNFLWHLCNGLLMQYPVLSIMVYSWKHRKDHL